MRVMRILTRPNLGGPTRQAVALWHAHRELGVATLLVTGQVDGVETELSPASQGVPRLDLAKALALGPEAQGWVEVPELGRGMSPWRDRRARRVLLQLMQAHRPDVVHTHTSKAGWVGRSAARAAGIRPIVHTFHGHVLQDYFGPVVSWGLARLEARLAKRTDLLIAVSGTCADELAEAGVAARERFVVVPPAVAVPSIARREAAREHLGIATGERRAVCIGRLVPIKRVDHFVAAIAGDPDWRGDICGDGPLRASLAALANQTGQRVLRRGAVPDIVQWLSAYDALVLPSVREGCPLVAIEAFAAGVPVVGYDVPGVRDALRDWGHGILVPVSEGSAGLRAALHRLACEPALRDECIAAGHAAVARFHPSEVARQLLAVYRSAGA
jgi:glycosyltransferase involved in cell wall biosynthesis